MKLLITCVRKTGLKFKMAKNVITSEVMMIGTTLDVLPVTEYEGQRIGEGRQGPVALRLLQLLREDMKQGPKVTPVYQEEKILA